MVTIKENFILLKGVPNILNLSSKEIKSYSVSNGPRKIFIVLELNKNRINHYTKDKVYKLISDLEKRKIVAVINHPSYNLHVSYNKPTKQIILNLSPFNVDDIYSTEPDPKNIYTQLVYGILFKNLIESSQKIKTNNFIPIANFLFSMIIGLFGKEYGLLGMYSSNIGILNFLVNCYVLSSFFGVTGNKSYKLASAVSSFNYSDIEDKLNTFDFTNIENFIKSLSDFGVMPGIDKYSFTSKFFRTTGISFLPALEDFARFICIMTSISMKGSNIVPTYISKYNEDSFLRIIEISKLFFK